MISNLQHIIDLCSLHYSSHPPASLRPSTLLSYSPPATKPIKLQLTPYKCCNRTFSQLNQTLSHFFENHFPSITNTISDMQSQTPEHVQPCTIGNTSIHIVQRAAAFLKLFTTLPSNPRHFRPAPHSQSPFDFKNPYTSATALAYDFIQTVQQNPIEYSKFTSMLNIYTSITDYHSIWPYWAYYIYPNLYTKHTLFEIIPATNPTEEDTILNQSQPNNKIKLYVFACPFKPCSKTFISNPGFRTHIIKQHLQKRHFKADLLPEARTKHFTYTCPTMRCSKSFKVEGELRRHILHSHFTTYAKSINNG
ncbi:hypothetical protein DSO57_1023044 [Entomophthora muscae]|uniref:Uncharacterized protein n=1 Tax=Entomophthora muscae TaxID=34485 RepID=A0ACC2RHS5_9FUNG|nr:hypothetical protein DSO57_1023044 [Entomophthora muscae]